MIDERAGQPDRQWRSVNGGYSLPLTSRGGWLLDHRLNDGRRQWYITSPDGVETAFDTDGGLYLAIDMANVYIDERGTL